MKRLDRRLFTILLIVFVQMVGASLVFPILPRFAKSEFGLSERVIPLLLSAFFAAQFVAGPYLGRLSDKYGRMPILIISQIGTAISFAMLGLAQGAITLLAARLLDGITGGNIIVAQAYITDITPKERRTEALGYIFATFGLGFMVGPAIGGEMQARFGPRMPFYLATVAAIITTLITWIVLDESLTSEQRLKNREFNQVGLKLSQVWQNRPLTMLLFIAFIGQFVLGLIQGTFALFAEDVIFVGYDSATTSRGIGGLFAVIGLTQLVTQLFLLRPLLKRFGEEMLVIAGSVLRGAGMFGYAIFVSPWLALIASALFASGMGTMMPPLQSLATKTVPDELRGGALGLYQSSVSLSTIASTALSGILYDSNPRTPFWVGGVLALIVIVPAFYFMINNTGEAAAGLSTAD